MKIDELRKKSAADLKKLIAETEGSLREFRFKGAGTGERNVRAARTMRQTIARAKTLLRELTTNESEA